MKELRDLTAESFGLIIAYFLPGLGGLFSLALWSTTVRTALRTFLTANSNINLLLLVIFAALAVGMLIAAIRGFLYEFAFRSWFSTARLGSNDFDVLGQGEKLTAFIAVVDAHYRYHQCWGGMSIAVPILYAGWLISSWNSRSVGNSILPSMLFIVVEVTAVWAATAAYNLYVERSRKLLRVNKI